MTLSKLITQLNRTLVLGLCILVATTWAFALRDRAHDGLPAIDIAEMFYATRSALKHNDPYDPQTQLREFEADKRDFPGIGQKSVQLLTVTVLTYPPTTLLVLVPLALLSWPAAATAWLCLMDVLLLLAGLLMWDLAEETPVLAGFMTGFLLLNCPFLLALGNPAGVAAALCVIVAWCFVKERFTPAGVVLLVLSLALKPQVGGLLWLYFLLAGGKGRKWALQTLAVAGVLCVCAFAWIAPSPLQWAHETQRNLEMYSAQGGVSDPGPHGDTFRGIDGVIDLQSAVSVFRDNSNFYNPLSLVMGGGLILAWMIAVMRKRATREGALLALAAVAMLSLLPVYHRAHDAKLLLMAIPGCAVLWPGGGAKRWVGLGLTAAAMFVTGDVWFYVLFAFAWVHPSSLSVVGGKLALLALHPQPLVLLAAGCFYLWVYIRYEPVGVGEGKETAAAMETAAVH